MFSLLTRTRSDLCNSRALILLRDTRPRPLKGETLVAWAVAAGNLAAVSAPVDLNAFLSLPEVPLTTSLAIRFGSIDAT